MIILPAIDLYEGEAVRLTRGNYNEMTRYSGEPLAVADSFYAAGARWLHVVDLAGARDGATPNFAVIRRLAQESGLMLEVGGGIRNEATVERYLTAGVARVILGTAAAEQPDFTVRMVKKYGAAIAVGVDIRDERVAVRGWTELSQLGYEEFIAALENTGVQTIICTDVSRDGLLSGCNISLYRKLKKHFTLRIIASGGVTSLTDIEQLSGLDMYGAILGKALYTGALDLESVIAVAGEQEEKC